MWSHKKIACAPPVWLQNWQVCQKSCINYVVQIHCKRSHDKMDDERTQTNTKTGWIGHVITTPPLPLVEPLGPLHVHHRTGRFKVQQATHPPFGTWFLSTCIYNTNKKLTIQFLEFRQFGKHSVSPISFCTVFLLERIPWMVNEGQVQWKAFHAEDDSLSLP